jgi:hypothetical protein
VPPPCSRSPSCTPVRSGTRPRPSRWCATRWPRCRATHRGGAAGAAARAVRRGADLAAYYVAAARSRTEGAARAHLLRRAAGLYRDLSKADQALDALGGTRLRAGRHLHHAELAELLISRGQDADAALDALLLQADPFHPSYERHAARLQAAADSVALGRLEAARAERQVGAEAARSWLRAAEALRAGGREDDARAAEDRAFDQAPELDAAFAARRARVEGDVRALAELLAQRAGRCPPRRPRSWPSAPSCSRAPGRRCSPPRPGTSCSRSAPTR